MKQTWLDLRSYRDTVFIEIGTNVNPDWGVHFLKQGAKVFFVEAHPRPFVKMHDFVRRESGAYYKNATFINAAVSFHDEPLVEFELRTADADSATDVCTTLASVPEAHRPRPIINNCYFWTGAVSLRTLLDKIDEPVTSLRMDVEGSEFQIFGGWEKTPDWQRPQEMIIEKHSDLPLSPILSRNGYTLIATCPVADAALEFDVTYEIYHCEDLY